MARMSAEESIMDIARDLQIACEDWGCYREEENEDGSISRYNPCPFYDRRHDVCRIDCPADWVIK